VCGFSIRFLLPVNKRHISAQLHSPLDLNSSAKLGWNHLTKVIKALIFKPFFELSSNV